MQKSSTSKKKNDEIYELNSLSSSMQLQLSVAYQYLKEWIEKLIMDNTSRKHKAGQKRLEIKLSIKKLSAFPTKTINKRIKNQKIKK